MSEWYCDDCRRWAAGSCCATCLKINPADARWMTAREVKEARRKAMERGR